MKTIGGRFRSLMARRSLALPLALLLALLLLPGFALARPNTAPLPGDLGDAPDSTNHFGVGMTAYPAVPANFPTVFDPAVGAVQGPVHTNPTGNGWLGAAVTVENDADLMPDADGITNIGPPANVANRDGADDGVPPPNPNGIPLPQCQNTQFRYIVTGAAAVPVPAQFVNVWIDWNHDGDWADVLTCVNPAGVVVVVPEWAVVDQPVNVVPGGVVWVTPLFPSFRPGGNQALWMRINMAESKAPKDPATGRADGRGPAAGYKYGETEDYILRYSGGGVIYFAD